MSCRFTMSLQQSWWRCYPVTGRPKSSKNFHTMDIKAGNSHFREFQRVVQSQHFNWELSPFTPRKYSQTLEACPWQQSTNSERLAERSCFLRDNSPDLTRRSDTTAIDTFLYLHWLKHTLSFPWVNWHLTNFSWLSSKCC